MRPSKAEHIRRLERRRRRLDGRKAFMPEGRRESRLGRRIERLERRIEKVRATPGYIGPDAPKREAEAL